MQNELIAVLLTKEFLRKNSAYYTIDIFDLDLVRRMQLMIIKGHKIVLSV